MVWMLIFSQFPFIEFMSMIGVCVIGSIAKHQLTLHRPFATLPMTNRWCKEFHTSSIFEEATSTVFIGTTAQCLVQTDKALYLDATVGYLPKLGIQQRLLGRQYFQVSSSAMLHQQARAG